MAADLPKRPAPLRLDVIDRRSFAASRRRPLVLVDRYDRARQLRLRKDRDRYVLPSGIAAEGWHAFYRATPEAPPQPVTPPLEELPTTLELLRVHRNELRYRE
jgi:hypothetical protein